MFRVALLFLFFQFYFLNGSLGQLVLQGKVVDSINNAGLGLATITVFLKSDTSVVVYKLTDQSGTFRFPVKKLNKEAYVIVSHTGYSVYRSDLGWLDTGRTVDLGNISLSPQNVTLDELLVYSERPPILIRNDTVEFNANSFKTLPSDLLEDLIRKFPGLEIGSDGSIMFNGRAVNKITVDGREFFGRDPKVATRNLPAIIVDRVQIYEDPEEKLHNPDLQSVELGLVLNLKIKKSYRGALFGRLYAGVGSADRYQIGAILNTFRDTLQVSFLSFRNNLDKAGFDYDEILTMGGFERSGYSSMSLSNNGGLTLDGISFGGTGDGILDSRTAGLNINNEFGENVSANFKYFFGGVNSDLQTERKQQQFIGDDVIDEQDFVKSFNGGEQHSLGSYIKWKAKPDLTIEYRPNLIFTKSRADYRRFSSSIANEVDSLNIGDISNNSVSRGSNYTHQLTLIRRFKKTGRQLNISNDLFHTNEGNDLFNNSLVRFIGQPDSIAFNQLRALEVQDVSMGGRATYTEPISNRFSLQIIQSFTYTKNSYRLRTLFSDAVGNYSVLVDSLSNFLSRTIFSSSSKIGLKYSKNKFSVTPSLSLLGYDFRTRPNSGFQISERLFYFLPSVEGKLSAFRFGYRANVRLPSITDLQPVIDNTNPKFNRVGNIDLTPAIVHLIFFNYLNTNLPKRLTFHVYSNINLTKSWIGESREFKSTGVQVVNALNLGGYKRATLEFSFSKSFSGKSFTKVTINGGINSSITRSNFILNASLANVSLFTVGPILRFNAISSGGLDILINYRPRLNFSKYSNSIYEPLESITHQVYSKFSYRLSKRVIFDSEFDYFNNPLITGLNERSRLLINSRLSLFILKESKLNLQITINDILNQNQNISRQISENQVVDARSNVLQRYFLITVSYNLRSTTKQKSKTVFELH